MADKTLNSDYLVLSDTWPGSPAPNLAVPSDGFTGTSHHNVTTAAYKLGTKIQVYNEGTAGIPGFATFIYLQFETNTEPGPTPAATQVCTAGTNASLFVVTNDPDQCLSIAALPSAVMLSVMTTAKFGWFWCGGVCPVDFVSDLDGAMAFATNSSVALGSTIIASNLAADAIGYAISSATTTTLVAGSTLGADAA